MYVLFSMSCFTIWLQLPTFSYVRFVFYVMLCHLTAASYIFKCHACFHHMERVSVCFFFSAMSSIDQLCHNENKLLFDDDDICFVLDQYVELAHWNKNPWIDLLLHLWSLLLQVQAECFLFLACLIYATWRWTYEFFFCTI